MRDKLTTAAEVLGLASLSVGFGLVRLAFGLIAGGVSLVLVGYFEGQS